MTALLSALLAAAPLIASDHDDGEVSTKGRNRCLTDLFVFREGDQTGSAADNSNLILIMNTNPRSVARQHYFFSTTARYEFHVTPVTDRNARPTGVQNLTLRFTFGSPDSASQQAITVTRINFTSGAASGEVSASAGKTTPAISGIGTPDPTPVINTATLDGSTLTVFAGIREDPFFFDVEQFFRVRAGLLAKGPSVLFRSADNALDFAKGYNVNAIVVRVPIAFLQQGNAGITTFDVWETISVSQ
jgi:hypothetical protein